MQVRLRPVEPGHADFLLSLFLTARPDLHALPRDIAAHQFRIQQEAYVRRFGGHGHSIVVIDGEPAGRLWTSGDATQIRIVDIMLLPQFRGIGAGTILVSDVLKHSQQVVLTVRRNNPAVRLYLRLGFQISGGDELDLEMTWRDLAGSGRTSVRSLETNLT